MVTTNKNPHDRIVINGRTYVALTTVGLAVEKGNGKKHFTFHSPWTKAEDDLIIASAMKGEKTRVLATAINRPYKGIVMRKCILRKLGRIPPVGVKP
jgi:hypothetical protein